MRVDELYWQWSSDGSVMYVKRAYEGLFKRMKFQTIAMFYTSDFTDVQAIAEDFIERTGLS